MKTRKTTLYFSLFILFIIVFDAFQQQYYLRTYNIIENGASIPFLELFTTHFIRWSIWGLSCIPLALFAWRIFTQPNFGNNTHNWFLIISVGLATWILSITTISLLSIITNGDALTSHNFYSYSEFFIAQKGITFLFAYCMLILTIYNNAKSIVIDAQWLEINELNSTSHLNGETNLEPQLRIKIGNKLKLISLSNVTWIESDDYCVKIHTNEKSYSLRKSLKSLEEQLAPYQFIRVHRGALLNLAYLDQVDFEESLIRLQDSSKIPLSKSGAQILRNVLKASSI